MSKEKYSYEEFNNAYGIRDNERGMLLNVPLVVDMLNNSHKRIAELEEQIKDNDFVITEYENLSNAQLERIRELEEQLENARKETAQKVIKRVEELSVFDFEAYEEMDFRRYIISQMALDNILKEYGE